MNKLIVPAVIVAICAASSDAWSQAASPQATESARREPRLVSMRVGTRTVSDSKKEENDLLMSLYPAPVREYISARGGLPPPWGTMWVSGPALRGSLGLGG